MAQFLIESQGSLALRGISEARPPRSSAAAGLLPALRAGAATGLGPALPNAERSCGHSEASAQLPPALPPPGFVAGALVVRPEATGQPLAKLAWSGLSFFVASSARWQPCARK